MTTEKYITLDDLVGRYPFSKSFWYKRTCARDVPHVKIGKNLLFDPGEVDEWVRAHRVEPIRRGA